MAGICGMHGSELIEKISNGELDNCQLRWKNDGGTGTIEVKDKMIAWESGEFHTGFLTDNNTRFYIDGIVPIKINPIEEEGHVEIKQKINEIIEELKKLI